MFAMDLTKMKSGGKFWKYKNNNSPIIDDGNILEVDRDDSSHKLQVMRQES
jgi:hypothetical protein